ncbi:hypothetical protein VTK73DRAFT_3696 [Phialemonium thermophilum]|uniref:Zn(2)-C6 fungal-type domain-containing protein n=1 Tax=Phialemonium thermophilum TaxID=223376 RepID=A0ABR3WY72_9PEZI
MDDNASGSISRQACLTCRRQKRKCTRELPACQLCRKTRRICEYPMDSPQSGLGSPSDSAHQTLTRQPEVASFFLDAYVFSRQKTAIRPLPLSIPPDILEALQDGDQVQKDVDLYFRTVHVFFPIVSRLRLSQFMSTASEPHLDLALLLLTFRLMTSLPDRGSNTEEGEGAAAPAPSAVVPLYDQVKKCLGLAEAAGVVSVRLLQATLLLALFEIGQALYPAAYFRVSHCASIGHAMGIHDRRNATQLLPSPTSWTQMEELRRTWWGVLILDRYVSIGVDHRPFSCADARPEDLLPMDEKLWDIGEVTVIPSLAVSSSTDIPAPPFARTCQAAHLLSRVESHMNAPKTAEGAAAFYEEGLRLHGILQAFSSALAHEYSPALSSGGGTATTTTISSSFSSSGFAAACSAVALCFSAQLALYDHHSCAEADNPAGVGIPGQLRMQEVALAGLKAIGPQIVSFASDLVRFLSALPSTAAPEPERASPRETEAMLAATPLVGDCLYGAARQYLWYARETGNVELLEPVRILRDGLKMLSSRWGVAEVYLSILDGGEFKFRD